MPSTTPWISVRTLALVVELAVVLRVLGRVAIDARVLGPPGQGALGLRQVALEVSVCLVMPPTIASMTRSRRRR